MRPPVGADAVEHPVEFRRIPGMQRIGAATLRVGLIQGSSDHESHFSSEAEKGAAWEEHGDELIDDARVSRLLGAKTAPAPDPGQASLLHGMG